MIDRRRPRRFLSFAAHGGISFMIEVLLLVLLAAIAVGFAALGLWMA